jgi:signal recognition particle receptor subunit beta
VPNQASFLRVAFNKVADGNIIVVILSRHIIVFLVVYVTHSASMVVGIVKHDMFPADPNQKTAYFDSDKRS